MSGDTPFKVRKARNSDRGFVVSVLKARLIERAESLVQQFILRQLPESLDAGRLRVACDPSDEDTLLGFALLDHQDPAQLHYAYVRPILRENGIGHALVRPDDVRVYTFRTDDGERRFRSAERQWTYAPRITL